MGSGGLDHSNLTRPKVPLFLEGEKGESDPGARQFSSTSPSPNPTPTYPLRLLVPTTHSCTYCTYCTYITYITYFYSFRLTQITSPCIYKHLPLGSSFRLHIPITSPHKYTYLYIHTSTHPHIHFEYRRRLHCCLYIPLILNLRYHSDPPALKNYILHFHYLDPSSSSSVLVTYFTRSTSD